jgi:acetolactate synthase-1/2/3 large subunit
MNGAEILVDMLIGYGVRHVFGVPGDTNVAFYAALRHREHEISHILCRDERSAAFMADAYARVTNRPAVVEAPSGAGPMYSLPPLAESTVSAVPVLLLTFDMPLALERRGVISEFDAARLFHSIVKDSYQIKSARRIADTIRRSFRIATTGRPGAVHLVIGEDLLHQTVEPSDVSLHVEAACTKFPAYPAAAPADSVNRFIELLNGHAQPLLVAGGGVNRSGARRSLRRFADAIGLPVVNSITGQGVLPDRHPLALGVIGDNGFHPHAARAVEEADLLIYVGSKLGSVITSGWRFPSKLQERTIIQVDIDPTVLGNASRNALGICADAATFFDQLTAAATRISPVDPAWPVRLSEWRRTFWSHAYAHMEDDGTPLRPARVMGALNQRLRGPVTIVADPGTPTPYLNRYLILDDPEPSFVIPRGFGGLGGAIPGVVGAWLARPEARVIGLFGDGSFGMSVGELETIVRLDVPALLLHFNNGAFGLIKALQKMASSNAMQSVDFVMTDAARIAAGFGIASWRVTDAAALEKALDEALAIRGPAFIDIVVESIADAIPPMTGWIRRHGDDPLALDLPPGKPV